MDNHTSRQAGGDEASGQPHVADLLREAHGAVRQSTSREPYPALAAAALGFTALWLLWPEHDTFGAVSLKLWTLFVLSSVGLLFAPMWQARLRLEPEKAWRLAAGGAGGLGFAWVAFLLPSIQSNQAFFGTLATAAAALAVWTAPGRPQ